MPEYLSPGVYVEETQSGNKPIEGVSTSTTGLVGVTERGPVNVPQLITSFPEYQRMFGGTLPFGDFADGARSHCYLPYAVEGFFSNGGKRAWITRVLPDEAEFADRDMFFADSAVVNPGSTITLRPAQQGSGTTAAPPFLYVLSTTNFSVGDWVRIGDGSRSEYRQVVAPLGTQPTHVALDSPIRGGHPSGSTIRAIAVAPEAAFATAFKMVDAVPPNTKEILLDTGNVAGLVAALPAGAPPANWKLLEIGTVAAGDYVFATHAVTVGTQVRVTLARPTLIDYAAGTDVTVIQQTSVKDDTLSLPANAGDALAFLTTSPLPVEFTTAANVVIFDPTTANQEASSIGALATLPLSVPTYSAYSAGSVGVHVTAVDDTRTVVSTPTANSVVELNDVTHLVPGMTLTFTDGALFQDDMIDSINTTAKTVTLRTDLPFAPTGAVTIPVKALTGPSNAGGISLALDNRLGLDVGDVIRVGTTEIATIRSISGERGPAPDPGAVLLEQPLGATYAAGTTIRRQGITVDTARQAVFLALGAAKGSSQLLVTNGTGYVTNDVLEITQPDGTKVLHQLSGPFAAANPREVQIDAPLNFSHTAGQPLIEREPLFEVRAIDAGDWGNRLMIVAREENTGLVSNAEVINANPPPGPGLFSSLQLASITGVEPGTILEMRNPDGTEIAGLPLLKVRKVDRTNRLASLDTPGLVAAHMTAVANAALLGQRVRVRSREFTLSVLLRQRPDPTTPSRDDNLLDQEVFRWLSMDPRHSRYVEQIIGVTFTPGSDTDGNGIPVRRSDRRSEGASDYIRVLDLAAVANRQAIRLGPETLVDVLPSGLIRPARLPLFGGDDNVPGMNDAMYIGTDDTEPAHRTGLYTLKNPQTISLVAIPGQVTPLIQQSLIDQCEELRYRFAVLDGPPPDDDTVVDVQDLRQQFDTTRAALYHPWLTIPDPYPTSPAVVRQFAIPPAGHMLGIYARVDNERGVHKAPANEVVRGITGLTRYFAKGEQDILNPYPVNINVIRDFRVNNRAIRVWGARCVSSLPERKYINVNRLMIFLEDSIDRGLQGVVFEPNAEPLWASVRRTVTNFLTTVWRNGALEGETPEQGFFVKCDRTTMSIDDRENGRLIIVCGVAPVKPAEFVIFRLGLWTADAKQ